MSKNIEIIDIIKRKSLLIKFQLVISHHKAFPHAIEAFVRGIGIDGAEIKPMELFKAAEEQGLVMELNLLAMKMIIHAFKRIHEEDPTVLLFINVHESIVTSRHRVLDQIVDQVKGYDIEPSSIIYDIADYQSVSVEHVKTFIDHCREHGFYISVDDIGKGYFNLDRILLYNPDVIKINQQYLGELVHAAYRNRIIKQISRLAHEMGTIVVTTGIEDDEALKKAFKQGAQYFQGYYISKPQEVEVDQIQDYLKTEDIYNLLEPYKPIVQIEDIRPIMNKIVNVLNIITEESHSWSKTEPDKAFDRLFLTYPSIQNGWILNMDGIQVTHARVNNEGFSKRNANIFGIYDSGHDYTNEEYYKIISMGTLDVWITKPYVSLLTNKVCFTTASMIEPVEGKKYILCLVVNYDIFKTMHLKG